MASIRYMNLREFINSNDVVNRTRRETVYSCSLLPVVCYDHQFVHICLKTLAIEESTRPNVGGQYKSINGMSRDFQ